MCQCRGIDFQGKACLIGVPCATAEKWPLLWRRGENYTFPYSACQHNAEEETKEPSSISSFSRLLLLPIINPLNFVLLCKSNEITCASMKTLWASPYCGLTQEWSNWPNILWSFSPSILCNFPPKLPAFFFFFLQVKFMVLLDKLEGSECDVSCPNYLLQTQTSSTTIKLFDLKRVGDYGRRQFSTCFNDFVSASLTLWINLLLDLKMIL